MHQVDNTDEDARSGKFKIIKNLIVISAAFTLLFTAYDGLSMLQSTMNKEQGIGTVSQAVIYAGFCISSLLLPKYVIKKVGCKVALTIATMLSIPYIAANFYPTWFTMMPSAVLMGIGASLLWGSQCTYFNESALMFCTLTESRGEENQQVRKVKKSVFPSLTGTRTERLSIRDASVKDLSVQSSPECTRFRSTEELTANEIAPNYDKYYDSFERTDSSLSKKPANRQNSPIGSQQEENSTKRKLSITLIERDLKNFRKPSDVNGDVNVNDIERTDTSQSKKLANRQNSPTGNPQEENSTKRKLSITQIASDLKSLRKPSDVNGDVNVNEISVPKLSGDEIQGKSFQALPDSSYKPQEDNEVVPNLNPRKSLGYKEALQKFEGLESVTARFFGFNGFAFHSAQVWSNLISHYVLHQENIRNATKNFSCACGADFCNTQTSCLEQAEAISVDVRYLLTGVSVILGIVSVVLVLILLDHLPSDKEPVTFSFELIMATFNHCRKRRKQQFLIPISIYIGMLQGFYTADFTKSFVGCSWGTSHVGIVTIYFGIACAISSTSAGMLVKYTGRIPLMIFAQTVNIGVNALLLLWTPNPEQPHVFYISAAMWGIVSGTFWALLPAFYGVIFKKDEEAAFGSYYLWSSLGWFLSFLYSDAICTSIKMYILVGVSSVGIIGYLITEALYSAKKNQISMKYA